MNFLIVVQNVYDKKREEYTYINVRYFLEDHQLISFVGNFPLPKMQQKKKQKYKQNKIIRKTSFKML